MSKLEKLTITAYKDSKYKKKVTEDGVYIAMINPEKLDWQCSIRYNAETAQNNSKRPAKYEESEQTWTIDLVIHCTGAVDPARVSMKDEIDLLREVAYN